jgi:hypothetical protein
MALRLEDLLELLHSAGERTRERAIRKLRRLGRLGFTREQGLLVLKASSLPYPPRRDPADDTTIDLLRAALHVPYPEYLTQVVQRYPHWQRRTRAEALRLLLRIEDGRAAEAVMAIVRRHARAGLVPKLPLGLYANAPQHTEVFFPELLGYLDVPKLGFSIAALTLSFAAAHQLELGLLVPYADALLGLYLPRRDKVRPAQRTRGVAWRWDPTYHRCRWQAGVLLDLLGHVPTPDVEAELRRAVAELTDPRLRLYALLSLLRHDRDVEPGIVAEVAADPESRKWLYDGLQKLERFHLYPAALRTQAALAESDLVNWLIHPTELGRAPESIELVQQIPFDTGTDAGWADYYLFRFRTQPSHWAARYGWLAGVSGPFLRKDQPTIQALGDTFSTFTPWERKTTAEHVEDVRELMKTWRERHVQQEE